MANQIQLRRDTAANWTAVNPILADGEVGIETDTKKYKIGDGLISWTVLEYQVDKEYVDAADDLLRSEIVADSSYMGKAAPADTPTGTGKAFWTTVTAGTYTNFGGITVPANSFAIIARNTEGAFSSSSIALAIDLSAFYNKAETNAEIVNMLKTIIGEAPHSTLVSEIKAINAVGLAYYHSADTFSGEGWCIGNPKNFNRVSFKIKAEANITAINTVIKSVNKDGAVIANKNISVSLVNGDQSLITIQFDSVIANDAGTQLYFAFAANGFCSSWALANSVSPFPAPTYPRSSYKVNGNLDLSSLTAASIDGYSLWLYTKIELLENVVFPSVDFSEDIAIKSTTVQDNKGKITLLESQVNDIKTSVEEAFISDEIEKNVYESFPESLAAIAVLTTTFSGWGSVIGKPKNFNKIKFKVAPMTGSSDAITKVRYWIVEESYSGTILASGLIDGLNILPGTSEYLSARLSTTILNTADKNIWFFWKSDKVANRYGTTGVYNSGTYGFDRYTTTSQNFDTSLPSGYASGGGSRNEWVRTSLMAPAAIPTQDFLNQIIINVPNPNLKDIVTAEIIMPSRLYAVEGQEINMYFENIVVANVRNSFLDIDITCSKGKQYQNFYRINPVSSDAGSYDLIINVSFNGKVITTKTIKLYIAALSKGSGLTRNALGIGDSTLAGGQPLTSIIAERSGDVLTLNFKGTKGTAPKQHEGYSGWRVADFATQGRLSYRFTVSGITVVPGVSSYYIIGGITYYVNSASISGGSGTIDCVISSGSGTPAASGTLTKSSGTGDATISYSSFTTIYLNPFWIGGVLNFSSYLSANSISLASNDWVYIHLGINDVFLQTDDAELGVLITSTVTMLRALITNIKSAVGGLRVAVCVTIPPHTIQQGNGQDAYGVLYGCGQTLYRYNENIKAWQKRLITEFDNDTERSGGTFLISYNAVIDRVNNFPTASINVNSRNSTQILTYTNDVHPAQSGYDQMGDQLWAFLKYMA